MAGCQWREKPGLDPVCKTLPAAGAELCPRHAFMTGVREQQQRDREVKLLVEKKIVKKMPTTRKELLEQGYQAIGGGTCAKCHAPIQWFRTPNGSNSPWNPTDKPEDKAVSHFATCPAAAAFRRAS